MPQRGDKKTLLDLSEMNCRQYRFDRLKQAEKLNPEQKAVRLMKEVQDALHLPKMPYQIECFDNSNISGTDAVAACVVFKKMKPSKKDYRKYNIKTVAGPDDYASMKEVVRRRYSRLVEEGQPLPDLIVTDGGRGQMEVVREVVEDELGLSIPIAGLAKDDRHRTNELLFGFPPVVVGMKTDSELFRLLTRLQDEVHRFAITFPPRQALQARPPLRARRHRRHRPQDARRPAQGSQERKAHQRGRHGHARRGRRAGQGRAGLRSFPPIRQRRKKLTAAACAPRRQAPTDRQHGSKATGGRSKSR